MLFVEFFFLSICFEGPSTDVELKLLLHCTRFTLVQSLSRLPEAHMCSLEELAVLLSTDCGWGDTEHTELCVLEASSKKLRKKSSHFQASM